MGADASRLDSDLRVALLTGAAGWRDRDSQYTTAELAVVAVLGSCVAAVVTVLLVSAGLPADNAAVAGAVRWVVASVGSLTLILAVAPSFAWPLGWRPRRAGPAWGFAALRVGAVMLVVGCWTALLGPVALAPIWVLGGVVGCEYTLTAWVLGVHTGGRAWWWGFQRSGVHLGIWAVSLSVAAAYPDEWTHLLRVPLSFQVIAVAAAVTCYSLERLRQVVEYRGTAQVSAALTEMHYRLAQWLHDEVATSLRLLRLGLRAGTVTPQQMSAELEQLDHRLRLRQLEEMLASGAVQLAQVLQPYVRLAQTHGVEVVAVPRFDETSQVLDPPAGRLVQRALNVLVPNAIAAGTKQLAFRVGSVEPSGLAVELEDDAGGFDLAAVPAGRGLDILRRELGDGNLRCDRTDRGSILRVVVERTDVEG